NILKEAKEKMKRKNILKAALVLSIALAMIMPASAIFTDKQPTNSKLGTTYSTQTQQISKPKAIGSYDDILSEGFETAWVADSDGDLAPPGWEVHQTCTSGTDPFQGYWHRTGTIPFSSGSVSPHGGSWQAFVQWSYDHQDEWLVTPLLPLGAGSNLEFWIYGHYGSVNLDHYYVKLSPSGGFNPSDFTVVLWDATALPAGDNFYDTPVEIDLSAYDGQNVRLAWNFVDGDGAGLWYATVIDDVLVTSGGGGGDTTPPVTTYNITGTNPVTITLTATDDDSGVNHTYYKIDAGTYAEYTAPVQVTEAGDHIVYFYSVDKAGNTETEKSKAFTVEAPPITITIKGGFGVSVTIKNTGASDLTDIDWTIDLDGKLIFVGKNRSNTIDALAAGAEVTVKDFVIGFGKTGIAATAGTATASASGTALLFFVIGVA
ncbi:MAG TPA: choice-of-anchor J domain-containing protein, partial [Candidatus Thermoplasmatota archaeon]|nr:choice-of-anchor J domain-containing protein [Candidatus Thermoplasmatota archaeon]